MNLDTFSYNRQAAIAYAHKWAYARNPDFTDFSNMGGDCTNFASQCLLAGTGGIMNYTPVYGWYYRSINDRTASWTGVEYLYNFLTANMGAGPFAIETSIANMEPGDLVQLAINDGPYHHTPFIVDIRGRHPTLQNILVAAHSNDVDYRPLSSYPIRKIRFLHIEGFRGDPSFVVSPFEEGDSQEEEMVNLTEEYAALRKLV